MLSWQSRVLLAGFVAGSLLQAREARADRDDSSKKVSIRALSTRADRVTGGDVLVEVDVGRASRHALSISLNGRDVTAAFRETAPGKLVGLVAGLALGNNRLTVEGRGFWTESLRLTNYPLAGPVISGPHDTPFVCQTEAFVLPDGSKLGPAVDLDCSVKTKIIYVYLPAGASAFKALPSTTSLPADVAKTTTLTGVTVPFVVRVETGTVNRGIYQNAVLHDPTTEAQPSPFVSPKGWNKRLIAVQGFGCPGGWYIQGGAQGNLNLPGVIRVELLDPKRLGEGYATFANTLQHPSNNCNALLGGESMMMSKERFIEEFGVPRATLSAGCSGGSYTSLQYADAFPGLIDGALVACTFPDAVSIALSASDGHLLTHYFAATNPTGFTDAQKTAVSGYQGVPAFIDAANQAQRTDPVPLSISNATRGRDIAGYTGAVWNPAVPAALRYDPTTPAGRAGARPTVYDIARNVYGRESNTGFGFALRPFDNVGVQYGLAALNSGAISKDQFLDLNERIGGFDQDANYVAGRTTGDLGAIQRMQQSGISLGGGGGLSSIPVFDITGIMNDVGGYHYQWFHFATRDRMLQANGHTGNHVMWRGNPVPYETAWSAFTQWVEAVKADSSDAPDRVKVLKNRPASLVDGCWSSATDFTPERQTFSRQPDSACNARFPSFAFPRYVAGGPLKANVFKCRLKRIDSSDYAVAFTAPELQRLRTLFPSGVCDFSKRGVAHRAVVTWPSFGPSPDNLVFDVTRAAHGGHEHHDDDDD